MYANVTSLETGYSATASIHALGAYDPGSNPGTPTEQSEGGVN